MSYRILWIDDEIHFFKPHIEFLRAKGYEVEGVSNGLDGIELIEKEDFDIVLLDEMMPGLDGIETLNRIKSLDYNIPVVMITKNEDVEFMQSAIAEKVTDFLTKPVNPSQILSVLIKIFQSKKLQKKKALENINKEFNQIRFNLLNISTISEWIKLYGDILKLELDNEDIKDESLLEILNSLKEDVNLQFFNFIKNNYKDLLVNSQEVFFSHKFLPKVVFPELKNGTKIYLFLLDCMRADQWIRMTETINELFSIKTNYYMSILPSATPYSRNAIFSGKLPLIIHQKYPGLIPWFEESESGKNDNEYDLLLDLMNEFKLFLNHRPYFTKILDSSWAEEVYKKMPSLINIDFNIFVFNFLDIIIHHRPGEREESKLLQEIVFDEISFRNLAKNWFDNSWIFKILQYIYKNDKSDYKIIFTTDHGSILCRKPVVIKGDSKISYSLRFKIGNYLRFDKKAGWLIENPEDIFLPKEGVLTNYAFANDSNYFVFSGNVKPFSQKYNNNFLHGGISLEEMILPYSILTPKR